MIKIKVCGISRREHGLAALEAGADLLGFVFYPPSHRYVTPEQAAHIVASCREEYPDRWEAVGVFVNRPIAEVNEIADKARLNIVQLAGQESPEYCAAVARPVLKVVRINERGEPSGPVEPAFWNASRMLLDTERPGHYGGTGASYDWEAVRPYARHAFLAGGLTPTSVAEALRLAEPWGLDVSSGVERNKNKDPDLIREFIEEVRGHVGSK